MGSLYQNYPRTPFISSDEFVNYPVGGREEDLVRAWLGGANGRYGSRLLIGKTESTELRFKEYEQLSIEIYLCLKHLQFD